TAARTHHTRKRNAEERHGAERKRKAENKEPKQEKEAEEKRQAELKRQAEIEAQRQKEAEEKRQAELKRQAEIEERKRQKEAEERTALLEVEKRRRAATDEERSPISKGGFRVCETCPPMVVVRAGDFLMGSSKSEIDAGTAGDNEGPQRKIDIRQPLAVGRFEVTRDQFQAFVSSSGHRVGDECWTLEDNEPRKRADRSFLNPGYPQIGSHPAVCVSWEDANAYAEWLSKTTGKTYRLLSEAQWEYVARAGTTGPYGGAEADLCAYGNGADETARAANLPSNWAYLTCT